MRKIIELCGTLAMIEDYGKWFVIDTINYEDKWWLVYEWNEYIDRKYKKPKRIVLMDILGYTHNENVKGYDFRLCDRLRISYFQGPIDQLPKKIIAIDNPDIQFSFQDE
jgi:hypothetical protein